MPYTLDELLNDADPKVEKAISAAFLFHVQGLMAQYPDANDLPTELGEFLETVTKTATEIEVNL